jgi:hypothetical protein
MRGAPAGGEHLRRRKLPHATAILRPPQRGVGVLDGLLLEDGLLDDDGLLLEDGLLVDDELLLEGGLLVEDGLLLEDELLVDDGSLLEDELWFDCEPRSRELLLLELERLSGALFDELELLESELFRREESLGLELFGAAAADRLECFLSSWRRSFAVLEDELLFESAELAAEELDGALAALGSGDGEGLEGGAFCATAVVTIAMAVAPMING